MFGSTLDSVGFLPLLVLCQMRLDSERQAKVLGMKQRQSRTFYRSFPEPSSKKQDVSSLAKKAHRITRKRRKAKPKVNTEKLRPSIISAVQKLYTEVATQPSKGFHFPSGKDAALYVGYTEQELYTIPDTAYESFAGCGKPFDAGQIRQGETVLDIGSGAGTDTLLAAQKVGSSGKVIALDMTDSMLEKLRSNASKLNLANIVFLKGNAEKIDLPESSVDVVISNGVINLVPNKNAVFREIYRVLKPGGRIQIADIVLHRDIPAESRNNPQLWAECIVGADVQRDYLRRIKGVGFQGTEVVKHIDYFAKSPNQNTKEVAEYYRAESVLVKATKPL